jgi:broad specificity phosphatase PhoE
MTAPMVKTVHLVRHGHHALVGRVLCGRMNGISLDEFGCVQMARCAECMIPAPSVVQSSPQRRALQSASIVASYYGLPIEIVKAVDEIDCGDWTGRSFAELEHDPAWQQWNRRRGSSRPPNGESMQELQLRVVRHLDGIRGDLSDGAIVVVSHAEPIRAALLHYANIALDDFLSVAVDPASVSTLCFDRAGIHISGINLGTPL